MTSARSFITVSYRTARILGLSALRPCGGAVVLHAVVYSPAAGGRHSYGRALSWGRGGARPDRGSGGRAGWHQSAELIETIIAQSDQPKRGVIAMVAGIAITLFGATAVFAQLQASLNRIWGVQAAPDSSAIWGFIRHRVLSLGLVLTIALLLLVSLTISALLAYFQGYLNAQFPAGGIIWQVLNTLVSLALITVLIAMIFKFLPDAKIEWRDTWLGAFVTRTYLKIPIRS